MKPNQAHHPDMRFHNADLAPDHTLSTDDVPVPIAPADWRKLKRGTHERPSRRDKVVDPRYHSKELARERKKAVAFVTLKTGYDIAKELSDFTWFRLFDLQDYNEDEDYDGLHTFEDEAEHSHRRFFDCGRVLENEDIARSMEYNAPRPKIPEWRDLTRTI